jgi:hypothetical protein
MKSRRFGRWSHSSGEANEAKAETGKKTEIRQIEPGFNAEVAEGASLAKMPCRRPLAILLVEGSGAVLGELEPLSANRHEEIPCAARNRSAHPVVV